jgi:hypothetical protein
MLDALLSLAADAYVQHTMFDDLTRSLGRKAHLRETAR